MRKDRSEDAKPIVFDVAAASAEEAEGQAPKVQDEDAAVKPPAKTIPPKQEEVIWAWKVCPLMLPQGPFTNLFALAGTRDKQKNLLFVTLFSLYLAHLYLCVQPPLLPCIIHTFWISDASAQQSRQITPFLV